MWDVVEALSQIYHRVGDQIPEADPAGQVTSSLVPGFDFVTRNLWLRARGWQPRRRRGRSKEQLSSAVWIYVG
jgi:hypothetical protein